MKRHKQQALQPYRPTEIVIGDQESGALVTRDGIKTGKNGNIFIGKMSVVMQPLFDRHEKYYKKSKFHLWADVIILVAILGLIATDVAIQFWQPKVEPELSIALTNDPFVSGAKNELAISYSNKNTTLDNVTLTVFFPKGFTTIQAEPQDKYNQETHTFTLGQLPRGAYGSVNVVGKAWVATGQELRFSAVLNYASGKKEGSVSATRILPVKISAVTAELQLPSQIFRNIAFPVKISVANQGENKVENVTFDFGSDWIIAGESVVQKKVIVLKSLDVNEKKELSIMVKKNTPRLVNELKGVIKLRYQGQELAQGIVRQQIAETEPKISLHFADLSKVALIGSRYQLGVTIANEDVKSMHDITLAISSNNPTILVKNILSTETSGLKIDNAKIIIDKLEAGQEKKLLLDLVLAKTNTAYNQNVILNGSVSVTIDGQIIVIEQSSPSIDLASELTVKSVAYYYGPQGDQLGIGPLPPIVGLPTKYWIFWQADNSGNAINKFVMTAKLPENVTFTGNKSLLAGKLVYDEKTRQVSWLVDSLDKTGGDYKIGFEISITPTAIDKGKILPLLSSAIYEGVDDFAQINLNGRLESLSTNLDFDNMAHGLGRVSE
ncbi:MAG: hypothetical protein WCK11_01245 [Candidatus Falkowbacteria bacterium]